MAIFDALIDDVASRFGLGSNAGPLIREIVAIVTGSPGGVSGFLNTLKSTGLSSEVTSWMGHANATPLPADQLERALGSSVLSGVVGRLGLTPTLVSTAVAYALPKIIGLLTPGGVAPTTLPAEVRNFIAAAPVHRAAETPVRTTTAPAGPQVAPRRVDVHHSPEVHDEPVMNRWLWPLLGALAVLGLGLFFWPTGNRTTPVAPPVAQAPPPAPAPPVATLPARLDLANVDGNVQVSGAVHDEETKSSILNALKSVFGADKVQGDIGVDPHRGAAPWLVNFRNGIESLKTPGVQAVFDGDSVNIGGALDEADLNRITASMRSALGGSLVFGSLVTKAALDKAAAEKAAAEKAAADKAAAEKAAAEKAAAEKAAADQAAADKAAADKAAEERAAADKAAADKAAEEKAAADKAADVVVGSNIKAATELASLKSGFNPNDLIAALNHGIVNFQTGSTQVPASLTTFLETAGPHLKELASQVAPGTVLEIAGYTDNTGDAAVNLAISQKRAEAVRDAFIKAGANPDMLVAKGFGSADPIASNETPEGRLRNRRIEYRLVKAP
jgi:OmpA-OmpF porin, OOP family